MNRSIATLAATGLAAMLATGSALTTSADASQAAPPSGLGWSAVIHHKAKYNDNTGTLKMVGPTGSTITIGAVPNNSRISDVAQDGARVTTMSSSGPDTRFRFWNTKTRTATRLNLGGNFWRASYLSGGGILTVDPLRGLAYKRDAAGKALQRFYISAADQSWVNPNGTRWVLIRGNHFEVRSATTGALLWQGTSPGQDDCFIESEENSGTFLANCRTGDGWDGNKTWAIDYTSRTAPWPVAPDGYVLATSTTPRLASEVKDGSPLTPLKLVTVNTVRALPGGAMRGMPVGGYGNTAWAVRDGAETTEGLYTINLTTGARKVLLGGSKGGIILDASVIDGHH